MLAQKFNQYTNEKFGQADEAYGTYFVSLLGLRDQAHIFHWQTRSHAQHKAFEEFYDAFLEATDLLAEMLMGLRGRPVLGMNATISLKDYSDEAISTFIQDAYQLMGTQLEMICNPAEHEEVFDQARVIVAEIDKLKYLMTLS